VGDDSLLVFDQKFHGEKGSVTWYTVMMQHPLLLSPKFRAKYSNTFICCRKTPQ
jgi:hypothetical protein